MLIQPRHNPILPPRVRPGHGPCHFPLHNCHDFRILRGEKKKKKPFGHTGIIHHNPLPNTDLHNDPRGRAPQPG